MNCLCYTSVCGTLRDIPHHGDSLKKNFWNTLITMLQLSCFSKEKRVLEKQTYFPHLNIDLGALRHFAAIVSLLICLVLDMLMQVKIVCIYIVLMQLLLQSSCLETFSYTFQRKQQNGCEWLKFDSDPFGFHVFLIL